MVHIVPQTDTALLLPLTNIELVESGGLRHAVEERIAAQTTGEIRGAKMFKLHQLARDGNVAKMTKSLDEIKERDRKAASMKSNKGPKKPAMLCVTELLMSVNEMDDEKLTPLHYAARHNHLPVVRLLIANGAQADKCDATSKITPLHFAARYRVSATNASSEQQRKTSTVQTNPKSEADTSGQTDEEVTSVIALLVKKGARVNAPNSYGQTPLHLAVMHRGNAEIAQELLNEFADINAQDNQKMTALHFACLNDGNFNVVKLLLDGGANPTNRDAQKRTPLHYAADCGDKPVVRLLYERILQRDGPLDTRHLLTRKDRGDTPLFLAVNKARERVVKYLLKKGNEAIAIKNTQKNTPLHAAATAGNMPIVKRLIESGARLDVKNGIGEKPLHCAAANNHQHVIEYLLSKGAKIEAKDRSGMTPFLTAAERNQKAAVESLMCNDANVSAVDKYDRTAIFFTAQNKCERTLEMLLKDKELKMQILLKNGAKIDAKDNKERTPLHLAALSGRTKVARELIKWSNTAVKEVKSGDKCGAKLTADVDEDGNTPLHYAARNGRTTVVTELLKAGASAYALNTANQIPLSLAAHKGHASTVEMLLPDSRSDEWKQWIDYFDRHKQTALHLACAEGHVNVVKILLKRGASVKLKDQGGMNCLDLAIKKNQKEVAMVLMDPEINPSWKTALRNVTYDGPDGKIVRNTPLRKLIRSLPDVAEQVLNNCREIDKSVTIESEAYYNHFLYEFIDDTFVNTEELMICDGPDVVEQTDDGAANANQPGNEGAANRNRKTPAPRVKDYGYKPNEISLQLSYNEATDVLIKNHPLQLMVNLERAHLLANPLVISLLRHKWNTYGRVVFYIVLAFYVVFLALLTTYVIRTPAPYNANWTKPLMGYGACPEVEHSQPVWLWLCVIGIKVITAVEILKEVYQVFQRKHHYLSWENLIEWIIYISTLFVVFDFSTCSADTGLRMHWQWLLGAVCVFLAWINLVLLIRKFPRFGIYVVMFIHVIRTFVRFFVVFVLCIVAFALVFFMLFPYQSRFETVRRSVMKSSVMMVGELDFESMFPPDGVDKNISEIDFYIPFTYAIYCLFLTVMTILLTNLMIGLAVGDVKAVQEKATFKRLAMQVELVLHVEKALPCLARKYLLKAQRHYPNVPQNFCRRLKSRFFTDTDDVTQLSVTNIAKQLKNDKDPTTQLKINQEGFSKDLKHFKELLDDMKSQQKRQFSLMDAIKEKMAVKWEDQDEF